MQQQIALHVIFLVTLKFLAVAFSFSVAALSCMILPLSAAGLLTAYSHLSCFPEAARSCPPILNLHIASGQVLVCSALTVQKGQCPSEPAIPMGLGTTWEQGKSLGRRIRSENGQRKGGGLWSQG